MDDQRSLVKFRKVSSFPTAHRMGLLQVFGLLCTCIALPWGSVKTYRAIQSSVDFDKWNKEYEKLMNRKSANEDSTLMISD
eukprot:g41158.t1